MYGTHLMIDLAGCPRAVLGPRNLERYARELTSGLRFTALSWNCEVSVQGDGTFDDPATCGVSGCLFLVQSAVTLHGLWLTGECFVDLFTCAEATGADLRAVEAVTRSRLEPADMRVRRFGRGEVGWRAWSC